MVTMCRPGRFWPPWIPAFKRVKKTSRLRENSAVMAALDAAIHGKHRTFNMLLDGRVKCGHDNGGSGA
jgi:hypothetical protein